MDYTEMPRCQPHMPDSYHSDAVPTDIPLGGGASLSSTPSNQHQSHTTPIQHMTLPQHTNQDMGYSSPRLNNEWFGQYGNPINSANTLPQQQQQQQQPPPPQPPQQQHIAPQQMSQYGEPMIDPNFEPQSRVRSNTWPLRPPSGKVDIHVKQEPIVEICENDGMMPVIADSSCQLYAGNTSAAAATASGDLTNDLGVVKMCQSPESASKKAGSRRNAWGNLSYAELITKAIQASPEQRLTLSQVYEWMVQNVTYFKDKGDSNSSAGWKNSIRHNLSLHNKFMRVQNEGTGKSSWWTLNPDAKPGKAPRRRAVSMETTSPGMKSFEKKRGRAKKKVEAMRAAMELGGHPISCSDFNNMPSDFCSVDGSSTPVSSTSDLAILDNMSTLSPSISTQDFRVRSSSNASSLAGRLSPIHSEMETKNNCDSSTNQKNNLKTEVSPPSQWSPYHNTHSSHNHHDSGFTETLSESLADMFVKEKQMKANGPYRNTVDTSSYSPHQQQQQQQQHTYNSIKEPEYISNYLGHSSLSDLLGGGNGNNNGANANPGQGTFTSVTPPRGQTCTPTTSDSNQANMHCMQYNSGSLTNQNSDLLTNQNGDLLTNGDVNSAFLRRALASKQQQQQQQQQLGLSTPTGSAGSPAHLATPTAVTPTPCSSSASRSTATASTSTPAGAMYSTSSGHLTVMGGGAEGGTPIHGRHQMPVDLDVNYTATRAAELDCDMDSIISQELTLEGNLDFTLGPVSTGSPGHHHHHHGHHHTHHHSQALPGHYANAAGVTGGTTVAQQTSHAPYPTPTTAAVSMINGALTL